MLGVVAALVVTVLIAWVPGLAVCGALLPGVGRVARFAVAPAVSYALAYALASYLDLVGAPVTWWSVALPLVLVGAVVHVAQLRSGRLAPPRPRLAHLALLLAALVAYGLWMHAVGSAQTVPAYDDGANAGIFVHRIGVLQTIAPDRVIATDLGDGTGGVAFYPLALHLVASFVVALTGAEPGLALHVQTATLLALALPAGAFALTHRLTSGLRLRSDVAAGAAALTTSALPGMPWAHLTWGGLAIVSGVALTPAVLLAVVFLSRSRAPADAWRPGLALGLATGGLLAVHSSEVATCAVLGLAVLLAVRPPWRAAVGGLGVTVLGFVVVVGPVLRFLGGGISERSAGTPGVSLDPLEALRTGWVTAVSATPLADEWGDRQRLLCWLVTALVLLGIFASRRTPAIMGLTVGSGLLLLLGWWCLIGSPTAHKLAVAWYANGYRLLTTLTVPIALLCGTGLAYLAGRRLVRVALVSAAFVLGLGVLAVTICATYGRRTYQAYSVVTPADRAAFSWLGERVEPGQRVLNDSYDGSMWMYPLADVAPVFGPKSDLWDTPAFAERWQLLADVAAGEVDARALAIAQEYGVRYVMVGERVVAGVRRRLDPAVLDDSPAVRLVFRDGSARVYELVPGAAAQGTS